jgi:hypothetical protein
MKNLKRILVLLIFTTIFGCYQEAAYECECEVKECLLCFKYTETITIYDNDESYADWECGEHESELYERVNFWGRVDCNLIRTN